MTFGKNHLVTVFGCLVIGSTSLAKIQSICFSDGKSTPNGT